MRSMLWPPIGFILFLVCWFTWAGFMFGRVVEARSWSARGDVAYDAAMQAASEARAAQKYAMRAMASTREMQNTALRQIGEARAIVDTHCK